MSDHSRPHVLVRSPRTVVAIAIVLAAATGVTAGIAVGQRRDTSKVAHAVGAVAPIPATAQPAEPEHDPSMPSPAKVFEHTPAGTDAEPSTF